MKNISKLIICILCFITFSLNVKAACNDPELNDFVEGLKIEFFAPRLESDFSKEYLDKIGNATTAGYAYYFIFNKQEYGNKKIQDVLEIEAIDGTGKPGEWKYQEPIAKYGVGGYNAVEEEIYTLRIKAVSGKCKGQVLKSSTYTIPQFNMYVQTAYCEKYPHHELCQTFTDKTKNMNDAEFGKAMRDYEQEIINNKKTLKDLFLKYYTYVLCVIVPFILVSIYYKRRIKRLIKLKSQEEERHITRRKAELFFIAFLLLIPTLKAATDECTIEVKEVNQVVRVPGVNVSVEHCGWNQGGWGKGQTFNDNPDSAVFRAIEWGKEKVWAQVSDCYGNGWYGQIQRCIMTEEGGKGKIHVEKSATVTCWDHGSTYNEKIQDAITCEEDDEDCTPQNEIWESGIYCWGVKHKDESSCGAYNSRSFSAMKQGDFNGWTSYGQSHLCPEAFKQAIADGKAAGSGTVVCAPEADDDDAECDVLAYTKCPFYPCEATREKVEQTTEEYTIKGVEAYCVNPGEKAASKYKEVTLDANECANGNSSVDCGFINILLEAKYFNEVTNKNGSYKIPDSIVNLAMRLWGAYTSQGGFGTIGVGLFTGKDCKIDQGKYGYEPGNPCLDMVYLNPTTHKPDNTYLNVYVETVKYMLTYPGKVSSVSLDEYDTLKSVEVKDAPAIFSGLECVSGAGVLCGDENMQYALALFYNTKNGNKKFKEHMNTIFGSLSTRPVDINISSQSQVQTVGTNETAVYEEVDCVRDANGNCKINKTILNIEFSEEITTNSKRIDCTELRNKKNNNQSLTAEELTTLNYCNIEVTEVRAYHNDGSYTLYTNNTYRECSATDVCGSTHPYSGAIGKITACQKSMCIAETRVYADCKEDVKKIVTKIKYKQTKSEHGFKKYVSCNTANPRVNAGLVNQFLYKMEPIDRITDAGIGEDEIVELETYPYCEVDCKDLTIKESKKKCDEPQASKIDHYKSSSSKKTYETSIHDPSLSCILNTYPERKTTYDYSDYFGVNTDVCRIYCSDSAHFYLPEKSVIYTGLSLKYDIEYSLYGENRSKKSLTSIVEMRRDCVSEINFDYVDSNKTFQSIARKYGFDSSMVNKYNVNDWISLYNAVYHRVTNYENKRNETLIKLIYDLYNCNMFSNIPIERPKDNTTGPIFANVIPEIYGNNYGFEDCTINESTNTCLTYDGMTYDGGAKFASDSIAKSKGAAEVGDTRDTIQYKHTVALNDKVNGKNLPVISNVRYCKGKGCFDYLQFVISDPDKVDENLKKGEYALPNVRVSLPAAGKLFTVNAYNPETETYENMQKPFIEYDSDTPQLQKVNYITNNKELSSKYVPNADYAYFTISTRVGYYNDSEFQVQPYTGHLYDVTSGSPYFEEKTDIRTNLEKGLYPIDQRLNECTVVAESKKGTNYYKCETINYFGAMNTYHRNFGELSNGTNVPKALDKFYLAINAPDKTKFTCSFVGKYSFDNIPQAVYRNVELTDMFPSDRMIGKNWDTEAAEKYRENIKNYIESKSIVEYYDSHLEYSYTFTHDALMKIREDNAKTQTYTNNNIYGNTLKTVKENAYIKLRSRFVDIIETDGNAYGAENNRKDKRRGVSEYTENVEKERD